MQDPASARLAAMTGDLEGFARGFLDVLDRLGPEAAARYLGGLAEWCGSDLTDGLFLLPPPLWRRLDAIAADLQAACEAVLAAPDGAAVRAAERRVRAAAAAAVTLGREGREPAG